MNETRILVCLYVMILWTCKGDACSSSWVSSGTNCYYISGNRQSMDDAKTWCQSHDATLLIHLDELPDADKRAMRDHMTPENPYWIGIKKKSWDSPYFWIDGTQFDSNRFENVGLGWCASLTSSGPSLMLKWKNCNTNGGFGPPAQAKFICQRANCPNSAGWYSLFNICVWVSTRQESTYTSCEEIGGRLLRWQHLDAGKKFLLSPATLSPLISYGLWYAADGGVNCPSLFIRYPLGWSTYESICGDYLRENFICESDGSSSEAPLSTATLQSALSTSSSTEVTTTTTTQERNVSQSGTYAPQVSDDNSTVAYSAGGVAALLVLVVVAAVVAVMFYRRRRSRKDTPIEPSSAAAAFHNATYLDPATVIRSDPRHGSDPGQGVYSLATRPLPEQPIGARGGGGDGNMYDNKNDPPFNGNAVASNGHVVSSSSAGNGMVDNAVYSTVNKDKSKGQVVPGLSVSDAQSGGNEDNVVYSSVDKDKVKKGHSRNTANSTDKSFYRPDSTEMVMSENTEYVSGDDSGISTSETDYGEIKGSGRNMAELTHIDHPKSSNTRPDSTELLMSENTLYGDGSRNDGNDPADIDYYNVRGTENNLDSQTNQPATKLADRPDENEYYNVTDFQSRNANSDIGSRCRESFRLTLEENDVYCSGN